MSDKINKEQLNEILKQRLANQNKIEEKAMFLRQPPESLTSQTTTTTNTVNNNQNQSSSTDNKEAKK
jgi:spore germination protein GerM